MAVPTRKNLFFASRDYRADYASGLKYVKDFTAIPESFTEQERTLVTEKRSAIDDFLQSEEGSIEIDQIVRSIINEEFIEGPCNFEVTYVFIDLPHPELFTTTRVIKLRPVNFKLSFEEAVTLTDSVSNFLLKNARAAGVTEEDLILIDYMNGYLRPPFGIKIIDEGYGLDPRYNPIEYDFVYETVVTEEAIKYYNIKFLLPEESVPEGYIHGGFFIEPRGPFFEPGQTVSLKLPNFEERQVVASIISYFKPI